ncbi:MAG: tail fiber domain-containing protein [Thermoanaerobaculia bacterium]|jgi:hypothetical protein
MRMSYRLVLVLVALLFMAMPLLADPRQPIAEPIAAGGTLTWRVDAEYTTATLSISRPDGVVAREEFAAGETPRFHASSAEQLPDGNYSWELVLAPRVVRKRSDEASERQGPALIAQSRIISGTFTVEGSMIRVPDSVQERASQASSQVVATPEDQVIPDDLIVQGSECIGFDCVNNESFGFDTIRLKENNTRIKFDDTSVGTFPATDWQLTANDSASGGANKFSIEDITNSKVPFTVSGNAATNSIFVDSTGRVGFRTSTPVLDLHVATSNTPGMRLEQNNAGGFTAQTWDIAGNEANFFVRDVTGGSRLPFRIRPGAPTSSIDIAASGRVGIGTASPEALLHVYSASTADAYIGLGNNPDGNPTNESAMNIGYGGLSYGRATGYFNIRPDTSAAAPNPSLRFLTANTQRMIIDNEGFLGLGSVGFNPSYPIHHQATNARLDAAGVWQNGSSRTMKHDIRPLDAGSAITALEHLEPVRYYHNAVPDDEYLGFVAEDVPDIVATKDHKTLGSLDIVAVLTKVVQEQQKAIEDLKARIEQLEGSPHP